MNKQQIFENAWKLVKTAGMKFRDALSQAWALALQKADTIYKIVFKKEGDGTITEREIKNPTINSKGNLMFYSVTDEGTRSAKLGNILTFQKIA